MLLLDDPLSAVDAHVGQHLWSACICDLLGSKTRVLVTHHTQYVPAADLVAIVSGGTLAHIGTYAELVNAGVDFHQFELKADEDAGKVEEGKTSPTAQRREMENGHTDTPHMNGHVRLGHSHPSLPQYITSPDRAEV